MIVPLRRPNKVTETFQEANDPKRKLHALDFDVENDELHWNGVPLIELVERYGTPLKLTYSPQISKHIQLAMLMFKKAMERHKYRGTHTYCYCTKSSHFRFVLDEVLKDHDTHLEISSAFDIPIIKELYRRGKIDKGTYIICNGHKQPQYTQQIGVLIEAGFNILPVVDSLREIGAYEEVNTHTINIGIRIATDETLSLPFRTSRLGVRYSEVSDLYRTRMQHSNKLRLKMLHSFVSSGIQDTSYFWSELSCFVHKYCKLRKICPDLDSINIGGGLPIAHSLDFSYDYQGIIDQIIQTISRICARSNVPVPHLFTEFGSYTVGESGATIYQVIEQKQQNVKEMWYMINGSFITQLPDTWGTKQRFICLPLNHWSRPRRKVLLGGLTCDSQDFYGDESDVSMPRFDEFLEDQYVGLFHTGAYQEALGGYGGISHCLVPAPKHVIVDRDEEGRWTSRLFADKQGSGDMLRYLGYELHATQDSNEVDLFSSEISYGSKSPADMELPKQSK